MAEISRRDRVHEIIFEADTPAGKAFDIALLVLIVLSVIVVSLETIEGLAVKYGRLFYLIEWVLTLFFTLEYFLRIYSVQKPFRYIFSFYGIIDLLAILPTYLSLLLAGSQYLIVIRIFLHTWQFKVPYLSLR